MEKNRFINFLNCRLIAFILIIPVTLLSFFDNAPEVDVAGHVGGFTVGIMLGLAFTMEDSSIRQYNNELF